MFHVGPGALLVFSNLSLRGFAPPTAYQYTPGAPHRLLGSGLGIWPTVGLAPNATVSWRKGAAKSDAGALEDSAGWAGARVWPAVSSSTQHGVVVFSA
jgi:hypothetical protein